ncbi:glycosyltransferase [Chamaesiphon sp. OTE_20_metabat_361]|uniref:glycosyltransferase n=1 Tax=Chamaesiphon sp. OTE_20_metabat_361 TaxID=2964689 RepID=UPI00286B07FC|nr:glycosyltransferase [Chamaesiphon sp. OTE_20_metabat_361]
MKILHVIPSVSPVRGGTSRAVLDMVRALRDSGIDAEIATTNDDGNDLLDVPLGTLTRYDGIPTYFFPRFSPPLNALREFAFSGAFTTWLFRHIAKYDSIHVHAIFSYTSTVTMAISRLRGVPYLVTPHGMLCQWSLDRGGRKKQIYLKSIERANLDRAGAIHLTCEQERDDFMALNLKAETFVLPLGLTEIPAKIPDAANLLRQNLNCPADEPIILFLARLHYKKGLDYLIPALGKLRERRFTFVLAGSGTPEYEAEIQSLLRTAGIEDRTRMVGFIEGTQKDLLLQGADLFVLTSHSENFGIAVLEALVVGTPVLLTPGVGLSTVVRERELGYVADLNIEAITEALDRYLTEPNRAQQMGIHARKFTIENYNWDKIATDLVRVYEAIVDRQPISLSNQS